MACAAAAGAPAPVSSVRKASTGQEFAAALSDFRVKTVLINGAHARDTPGRSGQPVQPVWVQHNGMFAAGASKRLADPGGDAHRLSDAASMRRWRLYQRTMESGVWQLPAGPISLAKCLSAIAWCK